MDDWREYTSRLPTGLSLEEADLERSAEALIAKLEGFSERATGGDLSSSSIGSSSGSNCSSSSAIRPHCTVLRQRQRPKTPLYAPLRRGCGVGVASRRGPVRQLVGPFVRLVGWV